jgi:hypothetical protein
MKKSVEVLPLSRFFGDDLLPYIVIVLNMKK